MVTRKRLGIAAAAAGLPFVLMSACAPKSGTGGGGSLTTTSSGSSSGSGNATSGSSGGAGSGQQGSGGGDLMLGPGAPPVSSGGANSGSVSDACAAISHEPEQIIVYRDATVTDTVVTLNPIAIYIMQDRSTSMVGAGGGDRTSWPNSVGAITAFVNDAQSQGLDVGMGVFPPMNSVEDCSTGTSCGTPIVPIASLPNNARAIENGLQQATPPNLGGNGTPTECALRGMINQCLMFQSTSQTGETCVAVLVTDGEPTRCDQDRNNLVAVVKNGNDLGIRTFTIGLPGSNIAFLDDLAVAGGTAQAVDVSAGQQAFLDALNGIREKVVEHTTSTVSTPTTIRAPLDCQWGIPQADNGKTFDKTKVNVQLTPAQGSPTKFGYVASPNDCTQTGGGWYYDDPAQPTEVRVCEQTCAVIKGTTDARVDLLFGCETEPAKFN